MTFREYLNTLNQQKKILTIDDPVDPYLEAAEVVRQLNSPDLYPSAIHLRNLYQQQYSVIANLFAVQNCPLFSNLLWCEGRGLPVISAEDSFGVSLSTWLMSQNFAPRCDDFQTFKGYDRIGLSDLPILKYWPEDAGAYFSQCVTIVQALDGTVHCGIYRLQKHDNGRLTLHCHPGSVTADICRSYHDQGRAMPIALVAGVAPSLLGAALLPLEVEVDTFSFAGWLEGRPLQCCKGAVTGLPIPIDFEFMMEGFVEQGVTLLDGPHGNYRGYYTDPVPCPVIEVKEVLARKDAICPVTVVGPPPTESYAMIQLCQPYLQLRLMWQFCWVSGVKWIEGAEYNRAFVVQVKHPPTIDQQNELLACHLVCGAQLVVFIGQEIDLHRPELIVWRCFNSPWTNAARKIGSTLVLDASKGYGRKMLSSKTALKERVRHRLDQMKENNVL
nr:UbiD family decarboxylase domain-containing protein [uncultured Desulfuromonas sp.]